MCSLPLQQRSLSALPLVCLQRAPCAAPAPRKPAPRAQGGRLPLCTRLQAGAPLPLRLAGSLRSTRLTSILAREGTGTYRDIQGHTGALIQQLVAAPRPQPQPGSVPRHAGSCVTQGLWQGCCALGVWPTLQTDAGGGAVATRRPYPVAFAVCCRRSPTGGLVGSSALWASEEKCTLSQEMAAHSALGAQVGDRVPPPRLASWPTNPGHLPSRPGTAAG